MPDTVLNTSATSAVVTIGTSVTGTIDTAGDHDWYKVNLVAGQTYEFRLHGYGLTDLSNPTLQLIGTNGVSVVASNDDAGNIWSKVAPFTNTQDSRIVFTASSSGTYYLDVGAVPRRSNPDRSTPARAERAGRVARVP